MLDPSSHLEGDQYIMTKDTPFASSFLLEQKHSSYMDSSCPGDNGFLSPPTSNNFPSHIMLDFGSPSMELSCTQDLSSGWESPPGNMMLSCGPSVGLESLSQDTGISGMEKVDFTHDFASVECGSDSFLLDEETSILGSPDVCSGIAPYLCNAEDTNLHFTSTSRLGGAISAAVQSTVGAKIRRDRQKSRKRWSKTWKPSATDPSHNMPSLAVTCDKTCLDPEQNVSTATQRTSTTTDSVIILQSDSPGQGKSGQLFTDLSDTDMLLDTDGDSILNGTLASETGKPSEASKGLNIPAFWDGFDNYDTQCSFEQTTNLKSPPLFDHCSDLESFHDALAESSRYLETLVYGKQCVSNIESAEEKMDIKSYQNNTVPNSKPALKTTNARFDLQCVSLPKQSNINLETVQDTILTEDQLVRPDALEHLLLSTKQAGFTDDISYLYGTSSGGAQRTTCIDSTELPEELETLDSPTGRGTSGILFSHQPDSNEFSQVSKGFNHAVPLGLSIDTFTTTSNDQFLQGTKPSHMITSGIEVGEGMPQIADVNTTWSSIHFIANENIMSGNNKMGFPQVFSTDLDTVPAPLHDTLLIQPKDALLSQSSTDVKLMCFENNMYVLPESYSWPLSKNLHFSDSGAVSCDELKTANGQGRSSLRSLGYNEATAVQKTKRRSENEGTEGTDHTLVLLPNVMAGPERGHGIQDQLKNKRKKFRTQSPKYFPPRMCKKGKSLGVERNHSSAKEDQLDAVSPPLPEPVCLRTSLPIQQYHENIYIFPFDLHKDGQKGEASDELPPPELSDEVLSRISASLALDEVCRTKSREAHKKLKALESTDCIGRVHTEQGDFYCDGQYMHRKTVRQILKEAGFQRKDNETEIKLPVGKGSLKNRLRKKTSLSLDVKSRQEYLSGKKRKAEDQLQLGNQEHKNSHAYTYSKQKVPCYSIDSLSMSEQTCAKGVPTKPGKRGVEQQPVISQYGDVVGQQSVAVTSHKRKEPGSQHQVTSQAEAGNQCPVTSKIRKEREELPVSRKGVVETREQHLVISKIGEETEEQHSVTCQVMDEAVTLHPFTSQTREETREEQSLICQLTEKAISKIEGEAGNYFPVSCWETKEAGSKQSVTFQMRKRSGEQHLMTNQMRAGEKQHPVNIQFREETKNQQTVSNQEAENQQPVKDQQRKESGSLLHWAESQQSVNSQFKEGTGSQQQFMHHCKGKAETQQLVTCQMREEAGRQFYASGNSSQEKVSCQEEVGNKQFVKSHEPLINHLIQKVEIQYQVICDNSMFSQEEGLQHTETEQHPVISQCKVNAKCQQQLVSGHHNLHNKDTGIQQLITSQYPEESESQQSVAEQQTTVNQHTEAGRQPAISNLVEQTVEDQEPLACQHQEKMGNQGLDISHNDMLKEEAGIQQFIAEQQPNDSQHWVQADTEQLVNSHSNLHKEEVCLQLNSSLYEEEAQSQQPGNRQHEEEAGSQQSTASSSYRYEKEGRQDATCHHQELGILRVKNQDTEELKSQKAISSHHIDETRILPVTAECREETGSKQTVAEKEQVDTCQDKVETGSKDPVTSLDTGDSAPARGQKCQAVNKVNLVDDSSFVSKSFGCKTNIILYPSDSLLSSEDLDEDTNIVCCSPKRDTFEMTKESKVVETESKPVPSSFVVCSDLDINALPVVRKMGKVVDSETIYNGEIESLYRAPFLLVVHQATEPSSTTSVHNSGVMVVEQAGNMSESVAVTEGTCLSFNEMELSQSVLSSADTVLPVVHCHDQVDNVANNARQVQNAVNPCNAVVMVNSVSQHDKEIAVENTLCTGDAMIASVPTCTTDFADLTELLESNNQVVQPFSCKSENDLVFEASEKTNYFGDQLQHCSVMSAPGVHHADPVSVFCDGMSSSTNFLLDRAQLDSSFQSHLTVGSTCAAPSTRSLLSDYCVSWSDNTSTKPLQFSLQDVSADQFQNSISSFPVLSVTDGCFSVPSSENSQQNGSHALFLGTMVDFEDCVSMTGLEDLIGDCLLGASGDFVEDFTLKDAEVKQGNGISLSAVATDQSSGNVKSIVTQNLTSEKQVSAGFLPFLGRNTMETFHSITGLGTSSRSALRNDMNAKDQSEDRVIEATVNKTCQTYCKDMPGHVSCQISKSESKDSFLFKSRDNGDTKAPAVPPERSPQLEFAMHPDFKPVGLRFTGQDGFETSSVRSGLNSDVLKTDVIHQMESVSCGLAESGVKTGLCVDSVGTNCVTTQTCDGRTVSSASETDPLEVWMETMHSYGDSTFEQDVDGVKSETVTHTFLMNGSSHKWNPLAGLGVLPQVKFEENHLLYSPECLIQFDTSMPSAQGSTSVFSANATSMSNCDNYPRLIETNDSVHEHNSLSADSSFELLLEAFSQCSASACDSQSMLCGLSEDCANEKLPMENIFQNHVQDVCPTILNTEQACSASNIIHTSGCADPDNRSSSQMKGSLQATAGQFVENNHIKGMEPKCVHVPCHTPASVAVPELQSCLASICCGELSLVSSTKAEDAQHETSFSQGQICVSTDPLGVSCGSISMKPEKTLQTNASSLSSANHVNFYEGKMFADTFTFSTDYQHHKSDSLVIKDSLADKTVRCISVNCSPTSSCTTSSELQVASRTSTPANRYWSLNSPAPHSSSAELFRPVTPSSVASSSADSSSLALSPLFCLLDGHHSDSTCHPKVSYSSQSSPSSGQTMERVLPPHMFSSVENIPSASAPHMSSSLNDSSSALNVFLGIPPLVSSSSYISSVDASVFPILTALLSSDSNASSATIPLLPAPASNVFSKSSDSFTQVPPPTSFGSSNTGDLSAITNVLPEPSLSDSSTSLTSGDTLAPMPALTALSPPVPSYIFLPVPSSAALLRPSNSSEPMDVSSGTAAQRFSKITPLSVNFTDNEDNTYLSKLADVFSSSCPTEKTSTAQPLHAPCKPDTFSNLSNLMSSGSKICSSDTSLLQSVQSLLSELESSGSLMTSPATTFIGSSCQSQTHRPLSFEVLPQSVSSQLVSSAWPLSSPGILSSSMECSQSESAQLSVSFSSTGRQSVPVSLAGSSSGLSVSRGQTVLSSGTCSLLALPQSSAAGNSDAQKRCMSLTLSSRPASALWTSTMKFVVTPVPPNRFQPSCPCHPLVLNDGRQSPGLPCVPFSPAMLNCPTMVAAPCVAARPQDLPQNPCCISKDVYEYSPSALDIHMAQMMYKKAVERNAKAPARHCMTYRVDTICIGDFTFTVNSEKHSKESNIWISYLKKKLCYNMVFTQPVEYANCLDHSHIIRTEILFSSIIGLWGSGNKLLLELSSAPAMFLLIPGKARSKNQSKQCRLIDITEGQIQKSPYHFLTLVQQVADTVKRNLCEDPNFCSLLIHPVTVDLCKTYPSVESIEKDCSEIFCMCKGTCQHMKCRCFRLRYQCRGSCRCQNCHNQFNQLHGLRFPLNEVCADPCLMDRLSKVKNVRKFLETPVSLECCGTLTTFLYCTPGRQQCHKCSAYLQLSWCLAKVFIENSKSPRNHCKQCKRCVEVFMRHCEACGRCTKQDSKGSCLACVHKANCQNALEVLTHGAK